MINLKQAITTSFLLLPIITTAGEDHQDSNQGNKLVLETLLKSELEFSDNVEVIASRVTIPPNTSLPKHWHPGQEFAYVLEGSATLWQEGKEDIVTKQGDFIEVPYKQVHTAITSEEGATVLVFRVHEKGQPQRVLSDSQK